MEELSNCTHKTQNKERNDVNEHERLSNCTHKTQTKERIWM